MPACQLYPRYAAPPTSQPQQQIVADPKQKPKTSIGKTPAIADDVDVIEKEWIDKAKNIVDKTKDDPHQQNKDVHALKADYMKKRYGKDIKLTDD